MGIKSNNPPLFQNVEEYFSKVDVYSKIMRNNYMHHAEILGELRHFLEKHFYKKPFSFLDLGCGDAFFLSQVFMNTSIESYTAYDLSEPALNEAKNNMKQIDCSKQFFKGDISKDFFSSNEDDKYDLIWSSYALHHLSLDNKERFFEACFNRLKNSSYLILVDFVNDYKNRDKCMERYKEHVESNWTKLSSEDKKYLYDHVLNYDFPESVHKYEDIAKKAGFKKSEKVLQIAPWAYMLFTS